MADDRQLQRKVRLMDAHVQSSGSLEGARYARREAWGSAVMLARSGGREIGPRTQAGTVGVVGMVGWRVPAYVAGRVCRLVNRFTLRLKMELKLKPQPDEGVLDET